METERILDEFLRRQRAMYTGGPLEPVAELLCDDVVWHVPGTSPIAGDHRGRRAVLDYFALRRGLASGRMTVTSHGRMVRGDTVVELADGAVEADGRELTWRTVGVYRVRDGAIAEAWLVPLELDAFDRVWRELGGHGA